MKKFMGLTELVKSVIDTVNWLLVFCGAAIIERTTNGQVDD
jgi:hypothetical protein